MGIKLSKLRIRAHSTLRQLQHERQSGFTLIEVMISMVILTIGLVSLLGVFAVAISATQTAQQDMIAKQLAQEVMESIIAARQTANPALDPADAWNGINNVGPGGGVFVAGFQPINQAGTDGIIGTADDGPAETLRQPGPTGIITGSCATDVCTSLTGFLRKIEFAPTASGDVRSVTITIQYTTTQSKAPRTYVLSGMISQYR